MVAHLFFNDTMPVEAIVKFLAENKIIASFDIMYDGFDQYRKFIYDNYNHGYNYSSIHPEDERLLYALSKILQPKNAFIAGAYYGYFAVWLMKSISEKGGMCVLSDINREACKLAEYNFKKLGLAGFSKIMCEDAIQLLSVRKEPIDFILLDAMGKWNDPRPEYRGKQIYVPILKAAGPLLAKGSAIVMHNVRPYDFETETGRRQGRESLIEVLRAINVIGICYDSYNGLGVFIKN